MDEEDAESRRGLQKSDIAPPALAHLARPMASGKFPRNGETPPKRGVSTEMKENRSGLGRSAEKAVSEFGDHAIDQFGDWSAEGNTKEHEKHPPDEETWSEREERVQALLHRAGGLHEKRDGRPAGAIPGPQNMLGLRALIRHELDSAQGPSICGLFEPFFRRDTEPAFTVINQQAAWTILAPLLSHGDKSLAPRSAPQQGALPPVPRRAIVAPWIDAACCSSSPRW